VNKHQKYLDEQIRYYQARAGEYDEWFLRQGRYDRGAENNRRWFAEIEILRRALKEFKPEGEILELACGTGIWTKELLAYSERITAVDSSPEVLEINRKRTDCDSIRYMQADIFRWKPEREFDLVFFTFWLSHVPPELFESFWQLAAIALKPGGRVFFIDSAYETSSTAIDHQLEGEEQTVVRRKLNDGREFSVVKVFYKPAELEKKLAKLGWSFEIKSSGQYFIYGHGACSRGKLRTPAPPESSP